MGVGDIIRSASQKLRWCLDTVLDEGTARGREDLTGLHGCSCTPILSYITGLGQASGIDVGKNLADLVTNWAKESKQRWYWGFLLE